MVSLTNGEILLKYDEVEGKIYSLRDSHREYVGVRVPIFRIGLRDLVGEQILVDGSQMSFIGCEQFEEGFVASYVGCSLSVQVFCRMMESLEWKISITAPQEQVLEWVNFPQIAVPHDLMDNHGTSKILWGFNEGVEVEDLAYKHASFPYREPQYPTFPTTALYPAVIETQFLAYYNEESGLYFGAHDKDGNLKGIDFYPYEAGIMLHMRHYCGGNYGETYEIPYPMVMKSFRGGWMDAAQIYREWFEKEGKEAFIPIPDNPRLPDWYGESPVVVTYPVRGTYDTDEMKPNKLFPFCNALEHIARLEEEFGSKILVLLMHWEGTAPWAPPYVWPPFGGEEGLLEFIHALHERGDLLGVYCSGLDWTQHSCLVDDYNREDIFEQWNLKEEMCLSPRQELIKSVVVPNIRSGYNMCPTRPFTVEVLRKEVEKMVRAGIDYIQLLDQQHGGTSYFCYSKKHGHPPVPGKWQVDAVKNLLAEIEKETGRVLLGTESAAAEPYIPYLLCSDNRYGSNYTVGRPVPVYAYLFHEYVNNFMGNQVWMQGNINFEKSPDNLLQRLAYSFTAGDMLTVVLNQDGKINWCWDCDQFIDTLPEQESVKTLVKNMNSWRRGIGKKYLHTGKMVKPYTVKCKEHIIYCELGNQEIAIEEIHTSAWTSRDGGFGQFLTNFNEEDIVCKIALPEGNYRLYESEEQVTDLLGGICEITVKKLSVVMIERCK